MPDLHDLYGRPFAERYAHYEAAAARDEMRVSRTVNAVELWRKMLTMIFETGHPWITFKDPCNLRSPQQHVGVVHSSNLCTEITLNTSAQEIAVCNLGSINLANHMTESGLDKGHLRRTVHTAMRMLDNVIDINFYTVPEARASNLRHRPVGLGIMGYQDALYKLRIPFTSAEAVRFADRSMEQISYEAISASVDLAEERGRYPSFAGSLWSQGILPLDSVQLLQDSRDHALTVDRSSTLDWDGLRTRVKTSGIRNSNTLAIAPTATISNICGVTQSIEPTYQNLFVKSNMSGDFTVVNASLVNDLKALGLWDDVMISDLKYFDGSLGSIDRVPAELKRLYATSFEVEPTWLIQAAACRQKWIDQAQSLNLYIDQPSGRKLDTLYREAWHAGLKTTYYLRSRSATHVEKSTVKRTDGKLNAVAVNSCRSSRVTGPIPPARPANRQRRSSPCSLGLTKLKIVEIEDLLRASVAAFQSQYARVAGCTVVARLAAGHSSGRCHRSEWHPRACRRQSYDQLPRRRQSTASAEVQVGMGEVSCRLQQSLDAYGSLDAGGHRAVEEPERSDRG